MVDRKSLGAKSKRQGRRAERAVEALFDSWGWDPRKEEPDEGYDFNVEIPSAGYAPATRFLVQVKSSEEMTVRRDGSWSLPLKRNKLAQYRNHRLPVFIIGVNLSAETFRWCDSDDERSFVSPTKGKKGGKISGSRANVYLRLTGDRALSRFLDGDFEAAVRSAQNRRDDAYHSPVVAAKIRENILSQRDSRLEVSIDVVNGIEIRKIQARNEPVHLAAAVRLATSAGESALMESFRFGVPSEVETVSMEVKGSALFWDLPKAGVLSISSHPQRKRILLGYRDGSVSGDYSWIIEEDANLYRGVDGGELRVEASQLPLLVRMRTVKSEGKAILTYALDRALWDGCEVRKLPYLGSLRRLFDGVREAGVFSIGIREHGEGYHLIDAPIGEHANKFQQISSWLRCLDSLGKICTWADRFLIWSSAIANDGNVMRQWASGAKILLGEVLPCEIVEVRASCSESSSVELARAAGRICVKNEINIVLTSTESVSIPVILELDEYDVHLDDSANELVISRRERSKSWMRLNEGEFTSADDRALKLG